MKTRILCLFFLFYGCVFANTQALPADSLWQVRVKQAKDRLDRLDPAAIRACLEDMRTHMNFDTAPLEKRLERLETELPAIKETFAAGRVAAADLSRAEKAVAAGREILLANPLLDVDRIVVTRYRLGSRARRAMGPSLGTSPANYNSLFSARRSGYEARIDVLSGLRGEPQSRTIYRPALDVPVSDVQLHWNAGRLLFSSLDSARRWQIFEIDTAGNHCHALIPPLEPDLEFCDANYLPDGRIVATTNIGYNGVPCVHGDDVVANLVSYHPATGELRRLTFDQDGNWNPVVMPNGRLMYTRWEYTDLTHYFSRFVMHMNPDGTENKALYGSGGFFPNSIFDMKPLPPAGNRFIGIITGHHGISRSGRLVIFDPAKGRKEEKGMVQEIPFSSRPIVPLIKDELVQGVWPQFMKPYPLNEKYFLVACKPSPDALWGIYLADVFDNLTLVAESEGDGLTAPLLLEKRPVPPVIPSKVKPGQKEATVFIQDIYQGEGTEGVPRGTIKALRVFAYEYAYILAPSDHDAQGIQSGWDIKRVLGTVPVEEDGSALFTIPANTPVSLQPLDEHGAAVQWMRSWLTGMPGEIVSCIGCHENQNTIPIPKRTVASARAPRSLEAPEGGVRPFTFRLEVQPVLDRNCISCHDGRAGRPDFRKDRMVAYKRGILTKLERQFDRSYLELHPYVYRQGPESDIYVLRPGEYYANNSELIRILEAGHHGVRLSDADWRALYTWIDLNAPYFGAFTQLDLKKEAPPRQVERRMELAWKYSGVRVDWQQEIADYAAWLKNREESASAGKPAARDGSAGAKEKVAVALPSASERKKKTRPSVRPVRAKGFPFDATEARRKQDAAGKAVRSLEIAPGVTIALVWIPAGEFVMGDEAVPGASPAFRARIKKGFWMSATEITNEQFTALFPGHDSRYIGQTWKDHTTPGYPANLSGQPVVRVSWDEAVRFCRAVGEKNGCRVELPTEMQWEWAARAGSDQAFWFGAEKAGFGLYENLADSTTTDLAVFGVNPKPMRAADPLREFWDFLPKVREVNDGQLVSAPVASYRPNPWGLYDMNGNVAEWTASGHAPYPLGKKAAGSSRKIVRGGSWRERPAYSSCSVRKAYYPWQRPFNVGFRVVLEE